LGVRRSVEQMVGALIQQIGAVIGAMNTGADDMCLDNLRRVLFV
jgi:hypothetical protein